MDAYDKKQHELYESRPKSKADSLRGAVRYGNKGREYINNFLNEGGRDISLAYLRDLGFDSKEAEYLVQKMIKENRTLGMI